MTKGVNVLSGYKGDVEESCLSCFMSKGCKYLVKYGQTRSHILVNSFGKVCKQLPVNLLITRLDKKTPPYAFFIKMRPIFINVTEVHVNFKVKMLNYLCSTYSLWFKKMVGKFREIRLFFLDFLLSIYITHFLGCRSDILWISMVWLWICMVDLIKTHLLSCTLHLWANMKYLAF